MSTTPQFAPRIWADGKLDSTEVVRWCQSVYLLFNKVGSATVTPGTINAQTVYSTTITVTGAATGMDVVVTPFSTINAGLLWSGYVSATNTVTLRIANPTAGNIVTTSGKWTVRVIP